MVRSTFYGLNLGYKGVAAQQRALDVTGHNIANANTAGYSRQRAIMVTDLPMYTPNGYIGSGVNIINVERIRDKFLDQQYRNEVNTKGYWDATFDTYSKIEDILNEPINGSLRSSMDDFWKSWEDLSNDPESAAVRTTVVQKGITAADNFNHLYDQLKLLKEDIGYNIENTVADINSLAARIADVNLQIIRSESDGRMANDFRDTRDLLIEELSNLVDIDITEDLRGGMNIFVGGQSLVYTTTWNQIETVPTAGGTFDVKWGNGSVFDVKSGSLKGLIDARDNIIGTYTGMLDTAAKAFAEMTNAMHQSGFGLGGENDTGIPFFVIKGEDIGSQSKALGGTEWKDLGPVISSFGNSDQLNGVNIVFSNDPAATSLTTNWDNTTPPGTLTLTNNWADSDLSEEELETEINKALAAAGFTESILLNMRGNSSKDIGLAIDETAGTTSTLTLDGGSNPTADFGAANIIVNPEIEADVSKIAAAKSPVDDQDNGIGDNRNALKLAQIKYDKSAISGFTIDDYYRAMIGDIGISSNKSKSMANNQELLVSQIDTQREYVMGVSLDEEMTFMIQFQQAYNSSARFLTTIDDMLDVLVNRLGRVGL